MSILRSAVTTPEDSSGLSVADYFSEKVKASDVILVPPIFEPSGDPNRVSGEEAEQRVIEAFEKCGIDIPGIQINCFNGVRVISGSPIIIREVGVQRSLTQPTGACCVAQHGPY